MGWETAIVEVCRTITFGLIVLLLLFGYRKRNGWEKPPAAPAAAPTPTNGQPPSS
jgi:hypothetical protein